MDNELQLNTRTCSILSRVASRECTGLLLENRAPKEKFNGLNERVAVLIGDLDRRASGYFVTYR
jgi:hypothetical protein